MKPFSSSIKKYAPPTGIRRSQRLLLKGIYTDSYVPTMETPMLPACDCQGCVWDVLRATDRDYDYDYDSDDSPLTDEDIDGVLNDMEKFDDY